LNLNTVSLCCLHNTVSFYGDGYIHLQTVEASIQTLLHVRFRTSNQAGLLFLAAGPRDFLLLELTSGHLQVSERSLLSKKGINHLSDLAWHSIELTHNHHNVTMTVDRNSHTSLHMPGPDVELSTEDGFFIGGVSGLNHPYLPNIFTNFRGCVDEVVFNGHNLLSSLRPYSGYRTVHEVSLGCSLQFSAKEGEPISFLSSKAFIALPPWEVPQEGMFECELYPSAKEEDGIVLYSSSNQSGFVAIELREGHLVAMVGNGEGIKTELRSLTHVQSKPTWLPIQLHLLPHFVQLKVGKELIKANRSLELQVIQLKGSLFLGGLDQHAWEGARRAGLLSTSSAGAASFKGCLRAVKVNTQKLGLPHAIVTKDITVGCNTGGAPDTVTTTSPTDSTEFDVTTTQPVSNDKKNFLLLRKLEVSEGGRCVLACISFQVNMDFRKLDPGRMLDEGQEGILKTGAEEKDRAFSMLDLWHGRVMYIHGGSEDQNDSFMFSVFSSKKKELPMLLRGKHLHRFNISISPVNDAPVLSLPEGNLFTLVKNSKQKVGKTENVLRVSDPDSSPAELVFSSLGNLNTEAGHLEHQDYPGRLALWHVRFYSTSQILLQLVTAVFHSHLLSYLLVFSCFLSFSQLSNTVVLRIMAVALQHKLANYTGLEVNQGEASVITTSYLAVQVNVGDQAVEIRYDVTELPKYGELQRLHSSGEWKPTTFFSQKLLAKERIRYLSTYHGLQTQNNITDQFKCKISIGSLATEEVVFPIFVRWLRFKVTRSKMEVNGVQMAAVTSEDLYVISKGVKLNESVLYFRLLTVPKKGQLFLNNKVLQRNATFSQKNITDGLVKYELLNRLHDDTKDTFSFQVFSTHASSISYNFRIIIKTESTAITIVSKGLSILEGGSKVITKDILFAHTESNQEVQYSIMVRPMHGQIRKINLSNSTSINDNIVTFTNQDIVKERIMYVHDDSETKQDSFTFQAMVYKPHKRSNKKEDRNTTEHTFNISVQLVNDQRPIRVVDKVFHVARDGQRLVTLNDLRYRDDDSDFEDNWLVYTRRGIPMGELVLASDPSHKLYEFTQQDLEQEKVLFVHRGVSFGRFVLFVSDGKHYVSTLLEVMAQDPYLQVENNTGLVVQRGGIMTLTSTNLSVLSNLDIRDSQEVTFEVFLPPKHGVLCFNDGDYDTVTESDAISVFTQRDLVAGHLAYRHDGSDKLSDGFNVTARARERSTVSHLDRGRREVHLDIGVSVKIYLQRLPKVISNHPVVVVEGHNVSISREHLEVVHEDSQPSEIVFTVQSPPTLGFLQSKGLTQNSTLRVCLLCFSLQDTKEQQTTSFTQKDLNQGLILYHQQSTGSTSDRLLLEATNGVTKVGPITLEIDIIPILLPLQVSNLTLDEGSSLLLTSDIIKVASHHFSGMSFLLLRVKLLSIYFQVEREYISYVHDGSDTQRDNFTIVANQTEIAKHSQPCTVHINIIPINDETPVITVNQGLKVWVGSVTEITIDELSAEDPDTPPEQLEFIITPPSNGHLALKSAPSRHILNFTQNHIQSGQLVFVHSGEQTGVFYFNVTDGHHHPFYKLFSLEVIKPSVSIVNNTGLSLVQGRTAVVLTTNQLAAQTNGHSPANITYTVHTHPHHGRIAINDQEVTTFCQEDLQFGRVVYHMTDLSESEDSFQVSASASSPGVEYVNVTAETVKVTVQPLIYLREPVRVPSGVAVKLGKAMIDASELARISRTDPVFEVLSPPKHGKLVKVNLFSKCALRPTITTPTSDVMTRVTQPGVHYFQFTLLCCVSVPVCACLQMTYDPNRASQVLKSFTFRDVVQGRVAIEETLSTSNDQLHDNKSVLATAQGHTPARPLNDSFIFLLKAGNVQPAKGELHFTILPHHQMHHGPNALNKADGASHQHTTTDLPTHNRTTTGSRRRGFTTHNGVQPGLQSHIWSQKNNNRTQHKLRPHNRWENHTHSRGHGERSGSSAEGVEGDHSHASQPHTPFVLKKHDLMNPPDTSPVHSEVHLRPASDPLLIILPLLACLFLIIILVVLILVFRHRKEKQARLCLIQELAAVSSPTEGSPYLGQPERSVAMPSVVVTPLGPASCPTSPRIPICPRRRSLAPGITFWGPSEVDVACGDGNVRGGNSSGDNVNCGNTLPAVPTGFKTSVRSRSLTPTLKDNQYWV
uniref:Laminin G domain-containing protein n=1 Tax=Monopterus albus TaxID=43700 RepID=A0A3Q3JC71_MONAL